MSEIKLTRPTLPVEEFIKFEVSNGTYMTLFSTTITINVNNPDHKWLIDKINFFNDPQNVGPDIVDNKIKCISLVTIRETPPASLSIPIRGLKDEGDFPKDTHGDDIITEAGIVITVKDGTVMEFIHKPKRTTGKVSNKLG